MKTQVSDIITSRIAYDKEGTPVSVTLWKRNSRFVHIVEETTIPLRIYQKNSVVSAVLADHETVLDAVLSDGFVETSNVLRVGEWLVTNPGGERYVLSDESFRERYRHVDGELYRAIGRVYAGSNPFRDFVTIIAPWGKQQSGDQDCWFAVSANALDEVYLIGGDEFKKTYVPAEIC